MSNIRKDGSVVRGVRPAQGAGVINPDPAPASKRKQIKVTHRVNVYDYAGAIASIVVDSGIQFRNSQHPGVGQYWEGNLPFADDALQLFIRNLPGDTVLENDTKLTGRIRIWEKTDTLNGDTVGVTIDLKSESLDHAYGAADVDHEIVIQSASKSMDDFTFSVPIPGTDFVLGIKPIRQPEVVSETIAEAA